MDNRSYRYTYEDSNGMLLRAKGGSAGMYNDPQGSLVPFEYKVEPGETFIIEHNAVFKVDFTIANQTFWTEVMGVRSPLLES